MLIGILGAGRIGLALAGHFVKAGHDVMLANSRGPETLEPVVTRLGPKARAGTRDAVAAAPIVFLCLNWSQISAALSDLPSLAGRIVVDTSNALSMVEGKLVPEDLAGRTSSEVVADRTPGAKLVKACNTLYAAILAEDPREAGGRRVLFLSGDDDAANSEVAAIFEDIGFAPIILGSLAKGGNLQQAGGPLAGQNLIRLD